MKETRADGNGFIAWHSDDHAGAVYYRTKNQTRARDGTRTPCISPTFLSNENTKFIRILFSHTKLDCSSSIFERCQNDTILVIPYANYRHLNVKLYNDILKRIILVENYLVLYNKHLG